MAAEYQVWFSPEKRLQADGTATGVKQGIERLLADPEVDILLTLGVLSSNEVSLRGPLPEPVVGPFVLDPVVQGIPYRPRSGSASGSAP